MWANLARAALAWSLLIAIAFTGYYVVVVPLQGEILDNDLTLVYIGARIGLEHGWSHLYSLDLQHQLFAQLRPRQTFHTGEWYISPPPYAWLVVPLVSLGPTALTYVWLALLFVALIAAWWMAAPGDRISRWLWLMGALAWYPVLYGFSLVQPDLFVLLSIATAWRLSKAGRPYLAGAVLGLSVLKPTLALALPLMLLAAGRWRLFVTYAAVAVALAVLSLLVIGPQGFADYRNLLSMEQAVPNNRYFTLAYPLGPGVLSYTAAGLVILAGAAAAFASRRETDDRIFALGIVTTALAATYWHLQDYTILLLAAWLFWRTRPPVWQKGWLLIVAITAEFAWGFTPLPLLIALLVWFALLAWFALLGAPRKSEITTTA
ncbi:MAG TPA: glycosyltransferase family 87 protein [Candidatus Acidoferrum sp.]|nr:glycosyltransferase family 87 protein [Candidatus Acidoferrum sp.]